MPPLKRAVATATSGLALVAGANAADIHVPGDQPTIQQGIDAAGSGDRVLVSAGVYYENIDFHGHAVQVIGEGALATFIDGGRKGHVVVIADGEGPATLLQGFTLQNGAASGSGPDGEGGGLLVAGGSQPEIADNAVVYNTACSGGGVAVLDTARPRIHDNHIEQNALTCGAYGGGLYLGTTALAVVEANRIGYNTATLGGGIAVQAPLFANPYITRNIVYGNVASSQGGGVWLFASHVRLVDSLIVRNSAPAGAGVYAISSDHFFHPLLINDTIADNHGDDDLYSYARENGQVGVVNTIVRSTRASHTVTCDHDRRGRNVFFDVLVHGDRGQTTFGTCTWDGTLLTVDPQFLDEGRATHRYQLLPGSPAIDAGEDSVVGRVKTDIRGAPRIRGAAVDLGAFEAPPR